MPRKNTQERINKLHSVCKLNKPISLDNLNSLLGSAWYITKRVVRLADKQIENTGDSYRFQLHPYRTETGVFVERCVVRVKKGGAADV